MKSTRGWVIAILVLSFFGLSDASYLAEHALSNTPLICNVQSLSDCNIVASSAYAQVFGIPLAVYGVIFYGMLFVFAALELAIFDRMLRRILQGISIVGFIASFYFILVQIFLIGAFCVYCFASALIALATLVCATFIEPIPLPKRFRKTRSPVRPHTVEPPRPPLYDRISATAPKVPFAPPHRPPAPPPFPPLPGA